ncbi:MAG: aminoglycoside phosphotransferase family protein [Thermomicrobiales bacterium]
MSHHDEEIFADGNMTPVIRQGILVRRALPATWKITHALLQHLALKNFDFAPRVVRKDESYEWLSFMPGQSLAADLAGNRSPDLLIQVGQMIAAYHRAVADFVVPENSDWGPGFEENALPEVICHNDIAPWNTIVNADGRVTGLIDWDLIAPGPARWDLAYAAWRFGLLEPEDEFGSVAARANRITSLLDAYGLASAGRAGFIDLIRERAQHGFDIVETLGKQGVPGFATLYEKGAHHWGKPSMNWIDQHRSELISIVESG